MISFEYVRPWMYPKQLDSIFTPRDPRGKVARYSLIEAGTKTGKTIGCLTWLFEQAFKGPPNRNYWWIAPVYNQAEIAFRRAKAGLPQELIHTNNADMIIRIREKNSAMWFKSGEKPDNLFGEDVWAAVIDEASRMREESWHAIRSTLTATKGPIRIIGNVKGKKNWFYALARKAEGGADGMSYHKMIAADAIDAGILAQEEIDDARNQLPDAVFRELYLAEPSDDEGNPFGVKYIRQCVGPLSTDLVVAWGWDLAKSKDYTVGIGLDVKGRVAEFHRFQRSWEDTLNFIRRTTGSLPALVDATGVGDPVVEMLQKELASNFEGFKFTGPSKQQLLEGLAVVIQQGAVMFPAGVIVQELESFEYEFTRTGVRYMCPKGAFDDCVYCLALAVKCLSQNRGLEVWEQLGRASRQVTQPVSAIPHTPPPSRINGGDGPVGNVIPFPRPSVSEGDRMNQLQRML
jgi:Terminase RNaseH-like domain